LAAWRAGRATALPTLPSRLRWRGAREGERKVGNIREDRKRREGNDVKGWEGKERRREEWEEEGRIRGERERKGRG